MILDNMKKGITASATNVNQVVNFVNTSGSTVSRSGDNTVMASLREFRTELYYQQACKFVLGTGTTPVSSSDYALDAETSNYTINTVSRSFDTNTGKIMLSAIFTWNGADNTTISEIGLLTGQTSGDKFQILVAREVFDTPITVNNGDTFTVSMAIG